MTHGLTRRRHGRLRAALVVGTAAACALAGCSSSDDADGTAAESSSGGSAQEITFLTHWGPDQVAQLEAAAATFTESHPDITVTVQAVPFANLLSTLRTQGSSPNGPTIASIYDLWLPELVRDGLAAPAPQDVTDEVTANWPENLVAAVTKEGQLYGVPNEVDLYQLNYNTALFEAAGIEDPPATWDELRADAAALTDPAAGQQGFGVITNWASGVVHPFLSLAASNDGFLLDEAGAAALTSPNVLAVAELYAELVADGSIDPDLSAANANTTGPYLDAFANGKTAMLIMANWWQSSLKDAMGDDYANVATAPIPVGPDGTTSSSISYSWLTMVNGRADDAKQAAAWEFLAYLNGPDSGLDGSSAMGDILVGMGILPSRTSDLEAHSAITEDPFLASYIAALPDATPFPTVIGGDMASQALQSRIEAIVFGQQSPADAMQAANDEVDAALATGN